MRIRLMPDDQTSAIVQDAPDNESSANDRFTTPDGWEISPDPLLSRIPGCWEVPPGSLLSRTPTGCD